MKNTKSKKKKLNINLIKEKDSYTVEGIATLANKTKDTVRRWITKEGLMPIKKKSKPQLIMGYELKRFIKEKYKKNKIKTQDNEFNCRGKNCHQAVKSIPEKISIEFTNKKLGKYNQILIRGICPHCKSKLVRFSSDRRIKEILDNGTFIELNKVLTGNQINCINNNLSKEEKNNES